MGKRRVKNRIPLEEGSLRRWPRRLSPHPVCGVRAAARPRDLPWRSGIQRLSSVRWETGTWSSLSPPKDARCVFGGATTPLVLRKKRGSQRRGIINCLPPLQTEIPPSRPRPPPQRDLFLLKGIPRCLKYKLAPERERERGFAETWRSRRHELGHGESTDSS